MVSQLILEFTERKRPIVVDNDARSYEMGATLLQHKYIKEEENWETVLFWSRTLTKRERKCIETERECLSVVCGIKTLRPYIEGTTSIFGQIKMH